MKLFNTILKTALRPRVRQIKQYMEAPMLAQMRWFNRLLTKGQATHWGIQHGFSTIKNIEEFQQQVPLSDYEELKPYIERMMLGESDVLWKGQVKWFSKSSGTTNDKSKFIPVSDENLHQCHLRGSHDSLGLWYDSQPNSKIMANSKGLIMGGSLQSYPQHPQSMIGDVSAILLKNMPFYAKFFYTPSLEIALMDNWEEKLELMAKHIHKNNLTNIGGVPTWTIVLFRRILEITGKQNMLEVFPNFEVYFHGGVSFEPYREQFRAFFPADHVQYREIYNASEGFFASQHDKDAEGMLLLLDNGVFYEFIPMDEFDNENPTVLTIEHVEKGVNYALVISTNAGLWRYVIGDTIKLTSLYPHCIQITGRTKHFINVFGEEVMVENSDKALAMTCEATAALVCEYTVGPIHLAEGKGGHEWLIEFERAPQDLEKFRSLLDQNLQSINSDYEAKRFKDIALKKLRLQPVPKGTFHQWLKSKGKYGGQNKVPRLSNSRQHLEAIKAFIQDKL